MTNLATMSLTDLLTLAFNSIDEVLTNTELSETDEQQLREACDAIAAAERKLNAEPTT